MDSNLKDQSRQKYSDIHENFRNRAENMTRSGRDATAKEFNRLGTALHAAADKLNENNDYFAGFIDNLANKIDDFSGVISDREPKNIINSVQDFAKRNPAFTMGGLFVAGLAVSRFFKAGTEYNDENTGGNYESGT